MHQKCSKTFLENEFVSILNLYTFNWKCLIIIINLSNHTYLRQRDSRETIRLLRKLIYVDFKILWARSIIITKWIYRKERYEPNSRFFYLYEVKSWQNYSIDPLEKEKESKKINNRKILNRLHNFDLHTPIDRSYNESQKLISIDYRTFMTQLEKRLWSLFTTSNGRARKVLTAFTRTVESCPHRHR